MAAQYDLIMMPRRPVTMVLPLPVKRKQNPAE
jgi:hypothetical protein